MSSILIIASQIVQFYDKREHLLCILVVFSTHYDIFNRVDLKKFIMSANVFLPLSVIYSSYL